MDPLIQKTLEEHLGIFLFALFLSLLTCFIAWYRGYFRLPFFERSSIRLNFGHVLGVFALYFFVSIAVQYVIYLVLGSTTPTTKEKLVLEIDAVKAWANLIAMSFVLISIFFYLNYLQKELRENVLGIGSYNGKLSNLKNFGMGILSWPISFPLVVAVSQFSNIILVALNWTTQEQVAVRFFKSTMENPVVFGLTCLFVILVIPLIEEIIFRGFLQTWFAKFLGRTGAVLLTSLIFSSFHFSVLQGYGNIEILSSLFVLSYFLGFIYFRQQSIYASWGLHATFNGLNVLFMSLAKGAT